MIDLRRATDQMIMLVTELDDDQLALPTPCGGASVGDLVDHLGMFASNFARAARKELDEASSTPPHAFDAANLEIRWRDRLAVDLDALAVAWSSDEARQGSTWIGGMDMPAQLAVAIALDELIVHAWDLSAAIGVAYDPPDHEVDAAIAFVSVFDAPRDGRLFGPIVEIDPGASPFERLLGLTGRDPGWAAPSL